MIIRDQLPVALEPTIAGPFERGARSGGPRGGAVRRFSGNRVVVEPLHDHCKTGAHFLPEAVVLADAADPIYHVFVQNAHVTPQVHCFSLQACNVSLQAGNVSP